MDDYQKLLKELKSEIQTSYLHAEKDAQYQRIITNWKIGEHIAERLLDETGKAVRGERLYDRLAHDLKLKKRFLQYTVQFYKCYLTPPRNNGLSWSHYTALISLKDPAKRNAWEKRALKEQISSDELEHLIIEQKNQKASEDLIVPSGEKLALERTNPFIYRVIKINYIQDHPGVVTIDCGFDIHIQQYLDAGSSFDSGHIVQSLKQGERYVIKSTQLDKNHLYAYGGIVRRVLDGDTIEAHIDCWFGVWVAQKLRLRGLDAPEASTARGLRAKRFIENRLKASSFIWLKTYGSDKYDRYLVDILYLDGARTIEEIMEKGTYLNQELIEQGQAVIW